MAIWFIALASVMRFMPLAAFICAGLLASLTGPVALLTVFY